MAPSASPRPASVGDFMMSKLMRRRFFFVSLKVQVLAGLHRFWAYARLPLPVLLSMGVLMAQVTVADPRTSDDGVQLNKTPKTLFVVVDGIPADVIERVNTRGIDAVAAEGSYQRAYVGGELGEPTESPTVSAVGYMSLLTGTWSDKHLSLIHI